MIELLAYDDGCWAVRAPGGACTTNLTGVQVEVDANGEWRVYFETCTVKGVSADSDAAKKQATRVLTALRFV